jgi:hypothetical protein
LHNQSALRLKTRLLLLPGVIIASVPYQLRSAADVPLPGAGGPRAAPRLPAAVGGPLRRARAGSPASSWRNLTAGPQELQAEELQNGISAENATPIAQCRDRDTVDVVGTLRTVTLRPRGTSLTMEADLWDGTGNVTLIWLGRRDIAGIRPGRRMIVHGRITSVRGDRAIYNPRYELRSSDS